MAYKYKSDFRKLRTENKIINSLPFNSITKKMSTICMVKDKYFMFSKGAPDVLIEDCNRYLDKEGGSKPID